MHNTAAVIISSPRQAPGGAADNPVASAAATPSTAMQTPIAHHHGVQRQCRQRERGARRGRIGHRDVVENEEHAEETETEGGDSGPVAAARPSRLQQQRRRQHTTKAYRPAQNRKRNRIGVAGEIARDRRRSPAEATRDQRDRDPDPFAHAVSPH